MSYYHARGNMPFTIHPLRPSSPAYQITSFRNNHHALGPRQSALLKTCLVYLEAIDILYTTNTFVLHDIPTLITLAKTVSSQHPDSNSKLNFAWSARLRAPYPHPTWSPFSFDHAEWMESWDIVANMQGLRGLVVVLEYHESQGIRQAGDPVLEPLLKIRGLERFGICLGGILPSGIVRFLPPHENVRKHLHDIDKRPRGSNGIQVGESSDRVALSEETKSRDFALSPTGF